MKKLFNLKRLLKKRNNGGFTLIEVVISCALLGILIVGVVSFVSPIFSMISTNQKSARATLLAETLDSYIAGNLKTAKKVEVFTNTTGSHAKTAGMVGTDGLKRISDFMHENSNFEKYEVRCIGVSWSVDAASAVTGRKKLLLTNCKVDNNFSDGYNNTLKILGETKVFDDSLYDGLYPIISVEPFSAQDSSGTETGTNASGYKISAKIYSNQTCYSVISDAARQKGSLAFEGVTYVQFVNMYEPASGITELNSTQTAIDSGKASNQYTENGGTYYYPDTFIYYVVLK